MKARFHKVFLPKVLIALGVGATALSAVAAESSFPSKPLRLIHGSVPGTLVDTAARLYAERMSAYFKQPVVVEPISGATTVIAIRNAIKAPADGHTLLVGATTLVVLPHTHARAGYATRDFTPIGEMVRSPLVLVTSGSSPYTSLSELIAAAKKSPERITYASGGVGTTNHLAAALLTRQAGVKLTHVPYKAIGAAVPDVTAGRVDFLMSAPNSVAELMKSGMLRALAISSEKRSPAFPQFPTFREAGYPDATYEIWIGAVGPAGIPAPVRARLGEAMEAARNDPSLVKRVEALGQTISAVRTPAQFEAVMRADEEKLRTLVKEMNIVAE